MNKIEIRRGHIEEIDLIAPLWEKLRQQHHDLSPHFKERFQHMTWSARKQAFLEHSTAILFDYVIDTDDNCIVGYCISTIKDSQKTGEIESIYIDEKYRKSGIGRKLVENAVSWFDSNGVETQKLLVGVGNEQVLDFYARLDFYPVHLVLQKKKK